MAATLVVVGGSLSACSTPAGTLTISGPPASNGAPIGTVTLSTPPGGNGAAVPNPGAGAQIPAPIPVPAAIPGAAPIPGANQNPGGVPVVTVVGGFQVPLNGPGATTQVVPNGGTAGIANTTGAVRGAAPTKASIEAAMGTFPVGTTVVAAGDVQDFGGGTIYYPTGAAGTFGAVTIVPGYTAKQSSMAWLGPRLASQGFVVMTIDTLTVNDPPASRGTQALASLTYLTTNSQVRTMIDPNRLAVMGHSMGGGGALAASRTMPGLKASILMTPWSKDTNWGTVTVPTLVIGAQNDNVAPVDQHAKVFYAALPPTTPKEYIELAGASHFAPVMSNTTIAEQSISWLKRFVDGDTRYSQFICPTPTVNAALSAAMNTCPF